MADVQPVASVLLGFRVIRGTVDGPRFVRRLHPEPGVVDWTDDRVASLLFADRGQADLVRRQIIVREERCAAVVPSAEEAPSYLVQNGPDGARRWVRYTCKLPHLVVWTENRAEARRLPRVQALRLGRYVANLLDLQVSVIQDVPPTGENERAMAELNARAEW